MGPMPHLNFAPRWAAVRAVLAGLDVARLKMGAIAAAARMRAAVDAANMGHAFTRAKQIAGSAIAAAGAALKTVDRARIGAFTGASVVALTDGVRTGWPILRELADPRGRCNRQAFLRIAVAFLAIQLSVAGLFWLFGIETDTAMTLALNAPILWIGSTVCCKRLHDVGRSGWWLPGSFVIWFTTVLISLALISIALAETALEPGQPAFYVAFAAITLPVFGALLWLHTAPSIATANRYGPVTGPIGLSMPARVPDAAADTTAAPVAKAA